MDTSDPFDHLLLVVLQFANQPALSIVASLGGGMLVAFLARLSPKEDWKYLKDGPGNALAVAWFALALIRLVPRAVYPQTSFVCDPTGDDPILHIPNGTNCHVVSSGTMHMVQDYTWGQFGRDFFFSILQDLVLGAVGAGIGILAGLLVLSFRKKPASTG